VYSILFCFLFHKTCIVTIFSLIAYSSCGSLIEVFNIYCGSDALGLLKNGGLSRRRAHHRTVERRGSSTMLAALAAPQWGCGLCQIHMDLPNVTSPHPLCSGPLLVENSLAWCPEFCSLGSTFCLNLQCVDLTCAVERTIFWQRP